ncbi:MAG TPA: RNA-processing protein [Methanoregulaceae archaeon]|nr:RNA-processing protein [Methanoregulaceae archaeon]
MQQEFKIAGNRIGVLIGKGGETKRAIEERTASVLTIDSEEGLVAVEGEDPVQVLLAGSVVQAIGRGFSPENAFALLMDEDLIFEQIDLSGLAESPRQLDRIRGRVIGREGKAREQIEHMTGTHLSIQGKTVAIIGLPDQVKDARTAIEMLLRGVPHESVFTFLDRKRKEAKADMLSYYY